MNTQIAVGYPRSISKTKGQKMNTQIAVGYDMDSGNVAVVIQFSPTTHSIAQAFTKTGKLEHNQYHWETLTACNEKTTPQDQINIAQTVAYLAAKLLACSPDEIDFWNSIFVLFNRV